MYLQFFAKSTGPLFKASAAASSFWGCIGRSFCQDSFIPRMIRPIEVDPDQCVVQMRSVPPSQVDNRTTYYELLVRKGGYLSLCRFARDPGQPREQIAARVSPAVAAIVDSCSEPDNSDHANRSGTWWKRKKEYLDKLAGYATKDSLDDAVLVALADKVNNCEKTARDLHRHLNEKNLSLESFWSDFNAGDSCQEAWYRGLLAGFESIDLGSPLADALLRRFREAVGKLFDDRTVATT